jgi:hypothetical protein
MFSFSHILVHPKIIANTRYIFFENEKNMIEYTCIHQELEQTVKYSLKT